MSPTAAKKPKIIDLVPISSQLPREIFTKVKAVADRNERSVARQVRLIVKEWTSRPASAA